MKKILLYTLPFALLLASCTASKKEDSCCKKPAKTASVKTATTLPEESIYNLEDDFTDQQGNKMQLNKFAGKVTVAGMVFTHCSYACPRLTEDMKAIAAKLKAAGYQDVNYVLVSFDTDRDNPERLRAFADEMELDKTWTLLRGEEESVRALSILLDVQFEKTSDGNFSHSNVITVLDAQGKLATQLEGLEANNTEVVNAIRDLAKL